MWPSTWRLNNLYLLLMIRTLVWSVRPRTVLARSGCCAKSPLRSGRCEVGTWSLAVFSRSCSASFRSVPFSVPVPPQERNGRTERNGTISVLGGTERNDETGRSVPKLALQEKWMENPLKCVKNPNFFACGACRHRRRYILRITFKKIKRNFKKWSKYEIMDAHN